MLKLDTNVVTLGVAAAAAIAIGVLANHLPSRQAVANATMATSPANANTAAGEQPQWAASATGRVEPRDGEIRISSLSAGKIDEVLVKTNDKVSSGDLLIKLDDDDYYVKLAAAAAEAGVRVRERDEEKVTGLQLERRNAEDALASAERDLRVKREAFDELLRKAASADEAGKARKAMFDAEAKVKSERKNLDQVSAKPNMPLPTRLESSLTFARSDLSSAELALERTRIRAPSDGTVLNIFPKVGETTAPSPENVLVSFGNLDGLAVRAEVEERDATKVRVGQKVVIKADAFPDREFMGQVRTVAQSLASPRIATRGPRRPNDVEVIEVKADLDGNPPLFTGMRVDVFFKLDETASATPPAKTN